MTLDSLAHGQRAVVVGYTGDDPVVARLCEMGLLPGETVEVTGVAPFGDPLAVRVGSSLLAIRRREAAFIEVDGDSVRVEPGRPSLQAAVAATDGTTQPS